MGVSTVAGTTLEDAGNVVATALLLFESLLVAAAACALEKVPRPGLPSGNGVGAVAAEACGENLPVIPKKGVNWCYIVH